MEQVNIPLKSLVHFSSTAVRSLSLSLYPQSTLTTYQILLSNVAAVGKNPLRFDRSFHCSPSPSLHLIPHSPSLSFPTLKDLQSLLDNSPSPSPPPLSSPSLRIFHRVRLAASALRAFQRSIPPSPSHSPDHRRVVFYFTSLRIVRSTFTDCRSARSILRSLRISFDERDVSLDHQFLNELKSLLRHRHGKIFLPQLFIGGQHIGGAEEIRRLHETGELKRLVDGAPIGPLAVCQACGGERFVLCGLCNGSRKQYSEKGGGFQVCNDCNENGLRRCPDCCYVSA